MNSRSAKEVHDKGFNVIVKMMCSANDGRCIDGICRMQRLYQFFKPVIPQPSGGFLNRTFIFCCNHAGVEPDGMKRYPPAVCQFAYKSFITFTLQPTQLKITMCHVKTVVGFPAQCSQNY